MFVGNNIGAVLTMNSASVAIISRDGFYYLFDSHSRDESGVSNSDGKSCICCFDNLQELLTMIIQNMYIICKENANTQRNIYLLATIEVNNYKTNGQTFEMEGLSAEYPFHIFMSYFQMISSETMEESADTSTTNESSDPTVNTSATCESNDPTDPIVNTSPNCESNNINHEISSSNVENKKSSSQKKKKIRKPPLPRKDYVSKDHKKLIVNVEYVTKEMNDSFSDHRIASHDDNCRNLKCHYKLIGPIMNALQSTLLYECSACGFEFIVLSEPEAEDIPRTNDSIVLGCINNGIGFYQLEGLLTTTDLPCHNYRSYCVSETVVGCYVTKTAVQSMAEAAKEAEQLARKEGRVSKDNIACTTVIVDGTYLKRSYESGLYNSSSGASVVIDQHTNKVIDVGVANKRCSQCQHGNQPYHLCWQNFSANLSSTKMEAAIILELFQASVEKYNLIYQYLVSDGDSSMYQAIYDNNVYEKHGVVVEKRECINHMLRRLSKNLKKVVKSSQLKGKKKLQKAVTDAGVRSSKAIREAARHLNSTTHANNTKKKIMQEDLENISYHAFGQHANCKAYYSDVKDDTNHVLELIKSNVWNIILGYYARCNSLPGDVLLNSSNNPAKCVNNVIAAKVGGKRIDFCKLGGYTIRVASAVPGRVVRRRKLNSD